MLYLIVLFIMNLSATLLGGQGTIDEVELQVSYHGTMADTCENEEYRFLSIAPIPLHDCVIECAQREHCHVLNYRRPFQLCELYKWTENSTNVNTGNCFRVQMEDIRTTQTPCENASCPTGSSCDRNTNTCRIEECLEIPILTNGKVLGNLHSVGNKIKYVCDVGYQLDDDSMETAVCLENGTWSSYGECVKIECLEIPQLENGQVLGDLRSVGNKIKYVCDAGYKLNDDSNDTAVCLKNGTWSLYGECVKIECLEILSLENGQVLGDLRSVGDTKKYVCDVGYQLDDDSMETTVCLENGTSSSYGECVKIQCLEILSLENGQVLGDLRSVGDTIQYVCDVGYHIDDDAMETAVCLENGTWSSYGECVKIQCLEILSLENGQVLGDLRSVGDTKKYVCDVGYQLDDDSMETTVCLENGTWSSYGECVKIQCLEILSLENGQVLGDLRSVGDTIKYVCDVGYQINDDSMETAVCLENGTWSSYGECVKTETTVGEPCYTQTSKCAHLSVHCVWYKNDVYNCHCNFGYELDTTLNVCVKVCNEYSTNYTEFVALSSKYTGWYDFEDVFTVESLNECVDLCSSHFPQYLSIDMKYKSGKYKCYCNRVSEQQYTSGHSFSTGSSWTFYNRPCKTPV